MGKYNNQPEKTTTFSTVSAAWNKNETTIKRLQNIPASFNECPALDPLRSKHRQLIKKEEVK